MDEDRCRGPRRFRNVAGRSQLSAWGSPYPLDGNHRGVLAGLIEVANVGVAAELGYVGIVMDPDHVGDVLEEVGTVLDTRADSMPSDRLVIRPARIGAATRD